MKNIFKLQEFRKTRQKLSAGRILDEHCDRNSFWNIFTVFNDSSVWFHVCRLCLWRVSQIPRAVEHSSRPAAFDQLGSSLMHVFKFLQLWNEKVLVRYLWLRRAWKMHSLTLGSLCYCYEVAISYRIRDWMIWADRYYPTLVIQPCYDAGAEMLVSLNGGQLLTRSLPLRRMRSTTISRRRTWPKWASCTRKCRTGTTSTCRSNPNSRSIKIPSWPPATSWPKSRCADLIWSRVCVCVWGRVGWLCVLFCEIDTEIPLIPTLSSAMWWQSMIRAR